MAGTVVVDAVKSSTTGAPTFQNTSGTEIGTLCRAWVNFNGTGTVAIRASFNVSSITDNGIGNYTVNLINSMSDANYAVVTAGEGYTIGSAGALQGPAPYSLTTSGFSLACGSNTNSLGGDWPMVSAAIFR